MGTALLTAAAHPYITKATKAALRERSHAGMITGTSCEAEAFLRQTYAMQHHHCSTHPCPCGSYQRIWINLNQNTGNRNNLMAQERSCCPPVKRAIEESSLLRTFHFGPLLWHGDTFPVSARMLVKHVPGPQAAPATGPHPTRQEAHCNAHIWIMADQDAN